MDKENKISGQKHNKNLAYNLSELLAILIILGVIATIVITSGIGKQKEEQVKATVEEEIANPPETYTPNENENQNQTQYQPPVKYVTAKELEADKITITIQNDYNYDSMECLLLDSSTCSYLSQNSKAEAGTYKIINVGGYNTWSEAKNTCSKLNATPANIAQLKKLYIDGVLKCQDGTKNCNFWADEGTNDGAEGVILNAHSGITDHNKKELSQPLWQVLCINRQ